MASGTIYPHTVSRTYTKPYVSVKVYLNRFLGYKLRFGGLYGSAAGGLRKLVDGSLAHGRIAYIGYNQLLHKTSYEGGFTRPYRSYNPDINVAACTLCNVLVYIFH